MSIVGSIIKAALDINAQFSSLPEDVKKAQEEQLTSLLDKAKSTSFGIYHNFTEMLESDDPIKAFQQQVPITDYNSLNRRWWKRQQDAPNITWPGKPKYFALSSGTTGKTSKRIPVTDDMLATFRSVGQSQIAALANFDLPSDLFEKDVLMLSSSADLTEHNNHLEGEISGINSSNIPGWFDRFYKPGKEIAQIDDWDERVAAIVKEAPNWDIVGVAGIPSWVRMLLVAIIKEHKLDTIHDLWPNLKIYASGGVAFEPHRKSFEAITKEPLVIMDTYLASEGFFAFNARPNTMSMQLAFEHGIFFEFVPFDDRGFNEAGKMKKNPLTLHLGEVEKDVDYALIISSPAGAWRYMIGDTVKFTDLNRYEIVISGRTKYFLNVVGSQLSEEKLNTAVKNLSKKTGVEINEYAVAAVKREDGEYIHQWVLGTSADKKVAIKDAAGQIDAILQEVNKNYRVARQKALKGVEVTVVPSNEIYSWLEKNKKKGGQIKVPKVMTEKMMIRLMKAL